MMKYSTMSIIEYNLMDASSIIMEKMIEFHDTMLLILFMISLGILYVMSYLMINKFINRNFLHGESIEIIWTILPMIILIFTAIPSLKTLYMSDELINPDLTIKSIGHQWYWSYEYSDFNNIQFDSYMITETLNNNNFRLLDVDNRTILPYNFSSRMLVSSTDVIHSWTIPSMGVKIDAVPGRINQINISPNRPGLFFGQCSEICGINHSFMPITLEITNLKNFLNWIKSIS